MFIITTVAGCLSVLILADDLTLDICTVCAPQGALILFLVNITTVMLLKNRTVKKKKLRNLYMSPVNVAFHVIFISIVYQTKGNIFLFMCAIDFKIILFFHGWVELNIYRRFLWKT